MFVKYILPRGPQVTWKIRLNIYYSRKYLTKGEEKSRTEVRYHKLSRDGTGFVGE